MITKLEQSLNLKRLLFFCGILLILVSIYIVLDFGMFGPTTIYLEDGSVIKTTKISTLVIKQWYLKKKYLETNDTKILEKLKSYGVHSEPETLKVYLSFHVKPTFVELSILKALGVKIDEDSWIPVRYGGFYLAEIPVDNLFLVAIFPFIKRIGAAEAPTSLAVTSSAVEPFPTISRTIYVNAVPLTPTIIKIPVTDETAERILKGDIQVGVPEELKIMNISKNPPEIILSHTPRAEGRYSLFIAIGEEKIEIVITSTGVPKSMIPEEE